MSGSRRQADGSGRPAHCPPSYGPSWSRFGSLPVKARAGPATLAQGSFERTAASTRRFSLLLQGRIYGADVARTRATAAREASSIPHLIAIRIRYCIRRDTEPDRPGQSARAHSVSSRTASASLRLLHAAIANHTVAALPGSVVTPTLAVLSLLSTARTWCPACPHTPPARHLSRRQLRCRRRARCS